MFVLYSRADLRNFLLGELLTSRTVCMLVGLGNRLDMSVKFMVFSLCKYIFFNIFCSLMFSVEVCFFMIRLWKNSICGKNVFPMTAEYESHLQMMLHCANDAPLYK